MTSAPPTRHTDAGDETGAATAAAVRAEWQRVRDHTAETRAERYDPAFDTVLQDALCRESHRRDVADRAAEAAYHAHRTTDVAHRRLADAAAQPPPRADADARLHERGNVPKQESTLEYGPQGRQEWTRRPGGRCWPCHQETHGAPGAGGRGPGAAGGYPRGERRAAAVLVVPGVYRRGAGSPLELTGTAGLGRLECPQCVSDREVEELGLLVLPVPTKREPVAGLVCAPDDPWWEARVLHARLYPAKDRA
ncbi:hypothetical protein [Kitasatospora sp. HPMI-4]|uniref:hypothetical protein n=1 Tax=Kitasatospora sp. HPMI-4 TaxID=3448443 RepID=UPI003F1D84A5